MDNEAMRRIKGDDPTLTEIVDEWEILDVPQE
jgi:hypothetical protein